MKIPCEDGKMISIYTSIFHVPRDLDALYVILCENMGGTNPNPMTTRAACAASTAGWLPRRLDNGNTAVLCKQKKTDTATFVRNYKTLSQSEDEQLHDGREVIVIYDETGEFDDIAEVKSNQMRLGEQDEQNPNPFACSLVFSGCENTIDKARAREIESAVDRFWCAPIVPMFGLSASSSFVSKALTGMSAGRVKVEISESDWDAVRHWYNNRDDMGLVNSLTNMLVDPQSGIYLSEALSLARSGVIELSASVSEKMRILDELYEVKRIWDYGLANARVPVKINAASGIAPDGISELAEYLGVGAMIDARQAGVSIEDICA